MIYRLSVEVDAQNGNGAIDSVEISEGLYHAFLSFIEAIQEREGKR